MSEMGSFAEGLLLAGNPLKLRGRSWACALALLMTIRGWLGENLLCPP